MTNSILKSIFFIMFISLSTFVKAEDPFTEMAKEYYENQETKSEAGPVKFINTEHFVVPEGKELIQIMVMRHGKPLLEKKKKYTWEEANEYIQAYDTVGVEAFEMESVCVPDGVNEMYCSNLGRSINTAEYLSKNNIPLISDERFREFERQILPIPGIKMPLSFWLITARIPWIFGFGEIESLKNARNRSKEVAAFLDKNAHENKKTVLVAHGFLNRFLEKSLKKEGWTQVKDGGHDYLSVSVYTKLIDKKS